MRPTAENPGGAPLPGGVIDAFWRYEEALGADDVEALDAAFVPAAGALRTDASGTLVGRTEIARFRRERGGAPRRSIRRLVAVEVAPRVVVTAATTVDDHDRRATITQVWTHETGEWLIAAAHVGAPKGEAS